MSVTVTDPVNDRFNDLVARMPTRVAGRAALLKQVYDRPWNLTYVGNGTDEKWRIELYVPQRTQAGSISKRRTSFYVYGDTISFVLWEALRQLAWCIADGRPCRDGGGW